MRVAIVFDPDPSLGFDPLDSLEKPRRLGELLDDKADVLVAWREYDDALEDGYRTHVIGQGIWENVTLEQLDAAFAAFAALGGLPE